MTASVLGDVEKTIKGMWEPGIPTIQRLEVTLKDKHFASADMIREASKELYDKNRIKIIAAGSTRHSSLEISLQPRLCERTLRL